MESSNHKFIAFFIHKTHVIEQVGNYQMGPLYMEFKARNRCNPGSNHKLD